MLYTGATLLVAALVWVVAWLAARLALLTVSLAVAALLAALCAPLMKWLHQHRFPTWASSSMCLCLVVAFPVAIGFLVWRRASRQLDQLRTALTRGVDDLRVWLVEGPLSLAPGRVDDVRDVVVDQVYSAAPSAAVGAVTVLNVVAALVLILFTLFFFLRDGDRLWRSVVSVLPSPHCERFGDAGRAAWSTLSAYTRGVVVVALVDALAVGAALYLLDVPLFLSLGLLTFLGAFVPYIGAAASGAVAVVVTLVTNGGVDALVMAAVVLVVQQLEGNVLSPLIVGRAVSLHPLVVVVAVTAGTLLTGVVGALIAVPVVAVLWSLITSLTNSRRGVNAADLRSPDRRAAVSGTDEPCAGR